MKESKEEILAYIKKDTGWDDAKCLEFYEETIKLEESANEYIPIWYAYKYMDKNENIQFGVIKDSIETIEPLAASESYEFCDLEDYESFPTENGAKLQVQKWKREWKEELKYQKAWDKSH